jgi:hypothetical protein
LSIAFDAWFTYMYLPGTCRHIKNALAAGAPLEEIADPHQCAGVFGRRIAVRAADRATLDDCRF